MTPKLDSFTAAQGGGSLPSERPGGTELAGALAFALEPRMAAHAEAVFAVLADPALYEFIDESPPVSVEALRDRFARSESRQSPDGTEHWLNWVVRGASREVAGYVQATVEANLDTNVAYMFGKAHWGQGLATRAVSSMLDAVASEFGVTRFFIVAERANPRSIRVAERLGFAAAPAEVVVRKGIAATDVLMQKRLP